MSVVYKRENLIENDLFYDSREVSNELRINLTEHEDGEQ